MGPKEVDDAVRIKAAESIIFSDTIFKDSDEAGIVKMLNAAESHGAKTYAVDSSTDIGLRVSSLGGIVALLRFAIR
jgi:protein pelota